MTSSKLFLNPSEAQIDASEMQTFIRRVGAKPGLSHVVDFWTLHAWSITSPEDFWNEIWDWGGVIGCKGGKVRFDDTLEHRGRRLDT